MTPAEARAAQREHRLDEATGRCGKCGADYPCPPLQKAVRLLTARVRAARGGTRT
ncbi:MAG: hypothetical protein ACRDXX_22215 [Stackebrandtia sp.]